MWRQIVNQVALFRATGVDPLWGLASIIYIANEKHKHENAYALAWISMISILVTGALGLVATVWPNAIGTGYVKNTDVLLCYITPLFVLICCAVGDWLGKSRHVKDYLKFVVVMLAFLYFANGITIPRPHIEKLQNTRGVSDDVFRMGQVLKDNNPGLIICPDELSAQICEVAPAYSVLEQPIAVNAWETENENQMVLNGQGDAPAYANLAYQYNGRYIITYTSWDDVSFMIGSGYTLIYESTEYRMYRRL